MAVQGQLSFHDYLPAAAMAAEALTGIEFAAPGDLQVTHIAAASGVETLLSEGVHYSIGGDGTIGAGTITALAAWPVADVFHVERNTARTQTAVFNAFERPPPKEIEGALDRVVLMVQESDRDAAAAAVAAQTSAAAAAAIGRYYATRAGGAAAVALGEMFTSDETGTLAIYKVIAGAPFYQFYQNVPTQAQIDGVLFPWMAAVAATKTVDAAVSVIRTSGHTVAGDGGSGLYKRVTAQPVHQARFRTADRYMPNGSTDAANGGWWELVPENGAVAVEQLGAKGDAVTDDRLAFKYAAEFAAAKFCKMVASAKTYVLNVIPTAEYDYAKGPQPSLVLPYNLTELDLGAAIIKLPQGGRGIVVSSFLFPNVATTSNVIANIAAGSYVIPVVDGTVFAAGDDVQWRLGEIPYDIPETSNWGLAKVLSVAGNNVTLDCPIPEAFTLASVTGTNKRLDRLPPILPLRLRNFTIDGKTGATTGAENGVSVSHRKDVVIENVNGTFCGAGVIVAQYVEGMQIINSNADRVNTTQASYGKHLSFAECRGVNVIGGSARGMRTGIVCEADSEVRVSGYQFDNTWPFDGTLPASNTVLVYSAQGRSKIIARDTLVTGQGGFNLGQTSNGVAGWEGIIEYTGDTRIRTSTQPYNIPLAFMTGVLDLDVAGVRERYNLGRLRQWKRKVRLKDGMAAVSIYGPLGMTVAARAYCSPGATVGAGANITDFYLGKTTQNGTNLAQVAVSGVLLTSGSMKEIPVFGGTVAGGLWTARNENNKMLITTGAAAGLNTKDEFIEVDVWYATEESARSYAASENIIRSDGKDYDIYEALLTAVDLPSIAAGASSVQILTISGMTSSDIYIGFAIVGGFGGLTTTKVECQAGQIEVTFYNPTGAAIDLAARDMQVVYSKRQIGA